jgi:hypothetical protein
MKTETKTRTVKAEPQQPRGKPGRPTVQTAARAKIIYDSVARGIPYNHACAIAGISVQTFCDWRKRSPVFQQRLDEAIARGVESRLKKIEQASDAGDWRASAWLLEHTEPSGQFCKSRVQVEAVGQFDHAFVIPQKTLDEIAEARERLERKNNGHEQRQLERGTN